MLTHLYTFLNTIGFHFYKTSLKWKQHSKFNILPVAVMVWFLTETNTVIWSNYRRNKHFKKIILRINNLSGQKHVPKTMLPNLIKLEFLQPAGPLKRVRFWSIVCIWFDIVHSNCQTASVIGDVFFCSNVENDAKHCSHHQQHQHENLTMTNIHNMFN